MRPPPGFDEVMIVNPYDPVRQQGVTFMRFYPAEPPDFGYYAEPPWGYYAEPALGWYGEPVEYGYYGEPADLAEDPYGEYPYGAYGEPPDFAGWGQVAPQGGIDPGYGYAEVDPALGYYAEDPLVGYYAEDPMVGAYSEDPLMAGYDEVDPVGYYAEEPPLGDDGLRSAVLAERRRLFRFYEAALAAAARDRAASTDALREVLTADPRNPYYLWFVGDRR